MIEEDEKINSDATVEIEAATGPIIATPANQGGNDYTIASGIILSTLLP